MPAMASSARSALIVAIAAAMADAENQNDPVTKTLPAPSRNRSLPRTAASGWPFAMALLERRQVRPDARGSQLDPRCSRKPQRTSSRISAAPRRSHSSRSPRANGEQTSS